MRLISFRPRSKKRFKSRKKFHLINPRRKGKRHSLKRYRRNPSRAAMGKSLKSIFSPPVFMQAAYVTIGFGAGAKIGGMIYDKMFSGSLSKLRRFAGLVTFGLGAFAASKVRQPALKTGASGVSAAGIYDLFAQNLPAAGLKPISGATIDMSGVDLVGDDDRVYAGYGGDTIDVSGDMTELVGEDSEDRIYA